MARKSSFAKALRQARLKAGLSQSELAQRVGLTGSYISQLEAGHRAPLIARRVEALCKALGIPSGPLQEAAELERSSPTVRKKIEALGRDRARLRRTRDRLLVTALWIAGRQAPHTVPREPELDPDLRDLVATLAARAATYPDPEAAEALLDDVTATQREALLRTVPRLLQAARVDHGGAGAPAAPTRPVYEALDHQPGPVAERPVAAEASAGAFFLRVGDDEGHPRIEAGDLLLLDPDGAPHDGDLVVVSYGGGATVRRFHRDGDRLRLDALRPELPPLRLREGEARILLVRQQLRDLV